MSTLTPDDKLRLRNLRALHGRPERVGAPTSKSFIEHLTDQGVSMTTDLTSIYQGTTPLSKAFAAQIEGAFGLPLGWMSADHDFVYALEPSALLAHARLAALPRTVRDRIYAVVEAIGNEVEMARMSGMQDSNNAVS